MTELTALQKAQLKRQQMKDQGIEIKILNPIEKAKADPKSLRKAITAKCFECMGAGSEPNFRKLIRECTSPDCPLYAVRPYQESEENLTNAA